MLNNKEMGLIPAACLQRQTEDVTEIFLNITVIFLLSE